MALITSAATGNFNAGATWTGGVVPGVGDEARASTGHTVTITANVTCDEVSNAGTGIFTLNDGVTLTANVTSKSATSGRNCLQFTAASPAVAYIVGNCTGGSNATTTNAVVNTNTGALNITGNCTGGNGGQGGATNGCNALSNASAGSVTITGNCTGGGFLSANGAQNVSTGSIAVIGNCQGGTAVGFGVQNHSTGNITVVGISTGGSATSASGANNISTGNLYLTRAKGSPYGPGNSGAGTGAAVGASNVGLGVIEIQELEYGEYGMSPTSGTGIRLKKLSTNVAVFNYCDTAGAKTLVDATQGQMPAASDVRDGVSYASGALTGSCKVPAAGSVALGVPVGAGFGTAVLTPEAVWGASTRTLTAGGGISASDVWAYNSRTLTTSSGPTAVEIRQEIDANSTKLDATVSSRLASSAYTAPTTPPTAAQIATAVEGSLLNEADGQQVLNAIVGAIGNTNLSEVSLVAAIRSDIERSGGKLDAVPTAAANASAVWGTATKQITGGTVDTLTNSPSVPSAASIAAATRTELAVELARVDASVSSRMAASSYTAPANSDVAAIKAKTDALNTDRLANVPTVSILGNLIAQANS
jgi:hypothetical protein